MGQLDDLGLRDSELAKDRIQTKKISLKLTPLSQNGTRTRIFTAYF
jgi:hypothetical protein